jgi:hypothetical protein
MKQARRLDALQDDATSRIGALRLLAGERA